MVGMVAAMRRFSILISFILITACATKPKTSDLDFENIPDGKTATSSDKKLQNLQKRQLASSWTQKICKL